MAKIDNIYNKGSILPSIIEAESELTGLENDAQKRADEMVQEAKLSGEKLVEDAMKELPEIEKEERKKILDETTSKNNEYKSIEEHEIKNLESNIEYNRKRALDFIIEKILPNGTTSISADSMKMDRK